jgi:hypothetical protein
MHGMGRCLDFVEIEPPRSGLRGRIRTDRAPSRVPLLALFTASPSARYASHAKGENNPHGRGQNR